MNACECFPSQLIFLCVFRLILATSQTQSELVHCLAELTCPKILHFTEEDLRDQDDVYLASLPKTRPAPTILLPAEIRSKSMVICRYQGQNPASVHDQSHSLI